MIEIIASFDYIESLNHESLNHDSFVKGCIMFLDYDKNESDFDEDMYTDQYSFAMYVMKKYWNRKYKWNSIKIHFDKRVVEMQGEKIMG